MFAGSTILYKMLVCLSEYRGQHMENLFLATVDNAIDLLREIVKYTASLL